VGACGLAVGIPHGIEAGVRRDESAAMGEQKDEAASVSGYQAEAMLQRAEWALSVFGQFDRADVLRVASAAAEAGAAKAADYAKWAVEETGFGVVEHKTTKNELCSRGLFEHYKNDDFTGYRVDPARKMIEVARPAGVILALTPSTNPVCTVFYKIMLALLTRNAIVISPHPMAKACCSDAALTMARAAEGAGAPDGIIQVIADPNLEIIDRLMKSSRTSVILATGGTPMVRAAYGSGNPALGVGPGNCPDYVDAGADVDEAARHIAHSKSFDNSILCTNDSAVIAHAAVSAQLQRAMKREGCHFVSESERGRVEEILFPGGKFNIAMLGRDAITIAKACGLTVARNTRVLVVPLERIGDDYALSGEKLCPVLGYYEVETAAAGLNACRAMVRRHGAGHSAAIYSSDPQTILRFGAELNVLRIVVNAPCSMGAAGFQTHLAPTMTVGTGFFGRSSVAENVGPQHLIQWVKVAFNKDAAVDLGRFEGLPLTITDEAITDEAAAPVSRVDEPRAGAPALGPSSGDHQAEIRAEIRQIILEELQSLRPGPG
jgi:acyl-CoA reductase-like NAD-dependent aldehyde dehydrogenase